MEKMYPVALSLISQLSLSNLWESIITSDPEELYIRIKSDGLAVLLRHLSNLYPADPLEAAKMIIDVCNNKGIKIIHLWDTSYPELLSVIHHPPLVMYQKGSDISDRCISIVGTRKADPASLRITERIVEDIAVKGYCIVSGMAVGIDRQAHIAALKAGTSTVGVLAQGIDRIYPFQNKDLFDQITASSNSCLVSEYPPGSRADKWTFARRNRIISGLCSATVVVKAGEKSGAMITARHAIDQNREVFACPGLAYDPGYQGCHSLIRNGAILVSAGDDIISELLPQRSKGISYKNDKILDNSTNPFMMGENESCCMYNGQILDMLNMISLDGIDIDDLVRNSECSIDEIQRFLVELELDNIIERQGTRFYRTRHCF